MIGINIWTDETARDRGTKNWRKEGFLQIFLEWQNQGYFGRDM